MHTSMISYELWCKIVSRGKVSGSKTGTIGKRSVDGEENISSSPVETIGLRVKVRVSLALPDLPPQFKLNDVALWLFLFVVVWYIYFLLLAVIQIASRG